MTATAQVQFLRGGHVAITDRRGFTAVLNRTEALRVALRLVAGLTHRPKPKR